MSELKVWCATIQPKMKNACDGAREVYLKADADKVIKEKDKEIARLDDLAHAHNIELLRKENLIAEVKAKLESVQATAYAESVDAGMENRKLKRAMWLARAERARDNSILLPSKFMRNVWDNVERKCLKKAEEYK